MSWHNLALVTAILLILSLTGALTLVANRLRNRTEVTS